MNKTNRNRLEKTLAMLKYCKHSLEMINEELFLNSIEELGYIISEIEECFEDTK